MKRHVVSGKVNTFTRRHFLKMLAVAPFATWPSRFAQSPQHTTPIPPSLMLHSRHGVNVADPNGFLPILKLRLADIGATYHTYQTWRDQITNEPDTPLDTFPVIVSIDDVGPDRYNPHFDVFANMVTFFIENDFHVVLGIVTRSDMPQDDSSWAQLREWAQSGLVELATHSDQHYTFSTREGRPRTDVGLEFYQEQITASAERIYEKTLQPVTTLITPFGSGFDSRDETIHPHVETACREAEIKFVVGIVEGRQPLDIDSLTNTTPLYLGRTKPGDAQYDNAATAALNLSAWHTDFYAPYLPPQT